MKHSVFVFSLLSLLFLGSCASDDSLSELTPEPKPETPTIPFTGTISFGDNPSAVMQAAMADPSPRFEALSDEEVKVAATWEVGDEMALVIDGTVTKATVSEVKDGKAYISARVVSTVSDGADARFIYPYTAVDLNTGQVKENLLAEQDGKLETIAKQFDVCEGSGKLSVFGGAAVVEEDITMLEKFSIMRFETRLANDKSPLNITKMLIEQGDDTYTVNLASAAYQQIYVVIKPQTQTLTVRGLPDPDGVAYIKSAQNANIQAMKFYRSTLYMTLDEMWFIFPNTYYEWDAKEWCFYGEADYPKEFGASMTGYNYISDYNPDDVRSYSTAVGDSTTLGNNAVAQYSAKDMPCAYAITWYIMAGDPHVDNTTVYYLGGKKYTGGTWFKKWNKIEGKPAGATITSCAERHPRFIMPSSDNGGRSTIVINTTGVPANTDDYFFLPDLSNYWRRGFNQQHAVYWTSSSLSRNQGIVFSTHTSAFVLSSGVDQKHAGAVAGHRHDGSAWFK